MNSRETKLETIKRNSRQLRGSIKSSLEHEGAVFDENDKQLIKFHGIYQQDDRDQRAARRKARQDKAYSFMLRSKIPGGRLSAEQYRVHDELCTRFGNGSLRITTRQDLQLHGVIRGDLRSAVQSLNRAMVTTLGACGDVVRNVMCCPVPESDPLRAEIERHGLEISRRFSPCTGAYHELWLDGEKVHDGSQAEAPEEPLYGANYLPRKFKIAIAHPGDNCVDLYTQDLGIVALAEGTSLVGFNLLVGGGLGKTHNKPETFPRLADPLTRVPPHELLEVIEQIVAIQSEFGDRTDRRHARLKYLIHDRGLDWFRDQIEGRLGRRLQAPVALSDLPLQLHLGWRRQSRSSWYRGISVENGRIDDSEKRRLRSGLRAVVERYRLEVRLTPQQDILLAGVADDRKQAVEEILRSHGIVGEEEPSVVRQHSMACPAMPTCGLALAEAERALPSVIDELELELQRLGLDQVPLTVRMTGCPNGCARPYVAELGFVGRSLDRYEILIGGSTDGSRLNQIYQDLVPRDALVETVRPLLEFFRDAREPAEGFGDFCQRVGLRVLRAYAGARRTAVGHG